jgi:ABC-2 type transport system ATP-binding protein
MSEPVELRDVRVRRGDFTLQIDRWDVPPGVVVGVVGANGAGKSTLLELLPGILSADSGTVRVLGIDPAKDPIDVRQQLGYMTDDLPYPGFLTISQLLWQLSGYWPTWDAERVRTLADRFELDGNKTIGSLSKGQGTRFRLVAAMAFRPKVLVLDEPATGLDVSGRRALLRTVLEAAGDCSVIFSSHDLADVERVADRLLVLHNGRVLAEGPTGEVIGDGRTLEEAALGWSQV